MNTNPNLIRILAFGDSNTWGRKPGDDNCARYGADQRWTGVLQNILGNEYEVIEEGLNGRTTDLDSPHKEGKNGAKYLYPCVESHSPLDYIILYLGKNDLKAKYQRSVEDITRGLETCINLALAEAKTGSGNAPQLILISPGIIEEIPRLRFGKIETDFLGANEKSKQLANLYEKLAKRYQAHLIDLSKVIEVSKVDGVHLEASEHKKIAVEIAKYFSK